MTKEKKRKNEKKEAFAGSLVLTEDFRDLFHEYCQSPAGKNVSQMLNDRNTPMKVNVASYRQINSWDKYGLIDIDRQGAEWRKYSIMDSIWLNIIYELRCFGYT